MSDPPPIPQKLKWHEGRSNRIAIAVSIIAVLFIAWETADQCAKSKKETMEQKSIHEEELRQDSVCSSHGIFVEKRTEHPAGGMRYGFDVVAKGPMSDSELIDASKSIIRSESARNTTSSIMFFSSRDNVGKGCSASVCYGHGGKWSGGKESDPMSFEVVKSWKDPI